MPPWKQNGDDLLLMVRVQPRASHNAITPLPGGTLQIRVTAAAVEDAANNAARTVLAKALRVPKSRVAIVRGRRGRHKLFRIQGLSQGEAARLLTHPRRHISGA